MIYSIWWRMAAQCHWPMDTQKQVSAFLVEDLDRDSLGWVGIHLGSLGAVIIDLSRSWQISFLNCLTCIPQNVTIRLCIVTSKSLEYFVQKSRLNPGIFTFQDVHHISTNRQWRIACIKVFALVFYENSLSTACLLVTILLLPFRNLTVPAYCLLGTVVVFEK